MKLALFLFLFAVVVLAAVTFLPSFFAAALPLLEIETAILMLAFLGGKERFGFAVSAGLIVDILHASTVFSHLPFFILMASFFWLWDALLKLEEPVLSISRAVLGFLVWPIFWAFVAGVAAGGIGTAAREAIFKSSQVILGRDIVFGLLAIGVLSAWQFYAFGRERERSLKRI